MNPSKALAVDLEISGANVERQADLRDAPASTTREPVAVDWLVTRTTHFTLPFRLLGRVGRAVPALKSTDHWPTELNASRAAEKFVNCVGFSHGQYLCHDLLVDPIPPAPGFHDASLKEIAAAAAGASNPQRVRHAVEKATPHLDWSRNVARGYCGWLMTNPQFLREHAELWQPNRTTPSEQFDRFCVRWQLKALPAPHLPEPLRPSFPLLSLNQLTERTLAGGCLIFLPHTFALMPEHLLRALLEDVVRNQPVPEHLHGWTKLVAAGRQNKGAELKRLGRLFRLQHHWRVLHELWAGRLVRKRTLLIQLFADEYRVSFRQMKVDVATILRAWDQAGTNR